MTAFFKSLTGTGRRASAPELSPSWQLLFCPQQ
jgi:hypothetical protein